jgi:hypothetical protein
VQCPHCREVVVLEALMETPAVAAPPDRVEALEARVAKLEEALADAVRAASTSGSGKFKWLAEETTRDFSPARAEALCHNLSVCAHRITIQSPVGDETARERAEWFKGVFERARWDVRGPEDAPASARRHGLALATSLPVSPEAAATFLALRAAGFQLEAAFDPDLPGAEERLIVA